MKNNKKRALKVALLTLVMSTSIGFSNVDAFADYKIKKGDTLYSIAKQHNISIEQLKKANNLQTNLIYAGANLWIPTIILVKKGDSLYKIANKYGLTVNDLKKMNDLKTNTIFIGQKLYVDKLIDSPYDASKVKVSISPQKGYTFDAEEPGKFILQYAKDGSYFARIEVLDAEAKIQEVKKNSVEYLKAIGKTIEIPVTNVHPFYKGAHFFLHAANSQKQANIVVKKVDGKLVKFTIHFLNKEESEGITPYIIEMLQTTMLN